MLSNDSRLQRWLDGLLEACWLAALISIPLFFNIHSERVFEPDKLAILRSIALLMAAAWLVHFIDQKGWKQLNREQFSGEQAFWRRPFVLVTLALITIYLVSTILSVTPHTSWAGSYQRLQGTYTTLSYLVIFAIAASTIRSREQISRIVTTAIIVSIPVAFYGLLQHYNLDPLPWGGDVSIRVAGHMGNAIFIAAYLIMVVPLTLARVIDAFSDILTDETLSVADVVRSSIYIFTLALQLIAIYWSGSRGPLLGLAVGLFAFVLILLVSLRDASQSIDDPSGSSRSKEALWAMAFVVPPIIALLISRPVSDAMGSAAAFAFFFGTVALSVLAIFITMAFGRGWRWLWLSWILLTLFLGAWLFVFNIPSNNIATLRETPVAGDVLKTMETWRELPTIGAYGRMLDPSQTTGRGAKSGRVRLLIWEGVVDLISPHTPLDYPDGRQDTFNFLRPFIGYGPESMYVTFNRFYPPELATVEARNASPDRSHNETFDALAITGVLGFLVWQILYLSVIFFAFRYLGAVRTKRDTWIFIGLLTGFALFAAVTAVLLTDGIFLGVAVPTGVMIGTVFYLIYYAIWGGRAELSNDVDPRLWPFQADRLLMNALVAAVLAHYVEIHFGIAIAATRLYFFMYVALIFVLGYSLPRLATWQETAQQTLASRSKKRKMVQSPELVGAEPNSGWPGLVAAALLLALIIGIMGYTFTTYALPPGKIINSAADLSLGEMFDQAFLQNARRDYVKSPFILGMLLLTWALGWLIVLSELVKQQRLPFRLTTIGRLPKSRRLAAAGLLASLALLPIVMRLISPGADNATQLLGQSLALGWGMLAGMVAILLVMGLPVARMSAGIISTAGLILMPALLVAGGGFSAVLLGLISGMILFMVWDKSWSHSLIPVAALAVGSLGFGLAYTFIHIQRYHATLFYQAEAATTAARRALEAAFAGSLLTFFYIFLFTIILLAATALSWPTLQSARGRRLPLSNGPLAYVSLLILFTMAFLAVSRTNVRIIQADMIFKRGRPFDERATRGAGGDPEAMRPAWDAAIAIYGEAIDLVPSEDFYYLFLGRALLERSALAETPSEQKILFDNAQQRLLTAQAVNPLNTDHTANLARLYTRWYAAESEEEAQIQRAEVAEDYYIRALELSPQNSVIRNEYALLALQVIQDCQKALTIFDESVSADPYYELSHLARADAYVACGSALEGKERISYFLTAADSLRSALEIRNNNTRAWLQLAEVNRQAGQLTEALSALEQTRRSNVNNTIPPAELDFVEARILAGLGEIEAARVLAEEARDRVSPQTADLIDAFLSELGNPGDPEN